jgi:hypothetical protein
MSAQQDTLTTDALRQSVEALTMRLSLVESALLDAQARLPELAREVGAVREGLIALRGRDD